MSEIEWVRGGIINESAERIAPEYEQVTGGKALMGKYLMGRKSIGQVRSSRKKPGDAE